MKQTNKQTKCRFGHSELLIPTQSAIKELQFDASFKTVQNVKMNELVSFIQYCKIWHFLLEILYFDGIAGYRLLFVFDSIYFSSEGTARRGGRNSDMVDGLMAFSPRLGNRVRGGGDGF